MLPCYYEANDTTENHIYHLTPGKRTLTKEELQQEHLLVEAAKKQPRRFGVLYERYYEQIFLFVFKRVDQEESAADVTSQVFLKAMSNLKKYQFRGVPFSAWLYRIAINEVNQYFREAKSKRAISMKSSDIADIMDEVEELPQDDNIQQMLASLQLLRPDELQMIELRFFEKLAFKEIAEIYNITENNAKVRMYRLLGKMKKMMAGDSQKSGVRRTQSGV
ncbi:MAG: sigma-70 family RNA polymerase sigma factor [Bacteroidota bacterium]